MSAGDPDVVLSAEQLLQLPRDIDPHALERLLSSVSEAERELFLTFFGINGRSAQIPAPPPATTEQRVTHRIAVIGESASRSAWLPPQLSDVIFGDPALQRLFSALWKRPDRPAAEGAGEHSDTFCELFGPIEQEFWTMRFLLAVPESSAPDTAACIIRRHPNAWPFDLLLISQRTIGPTWLDSAIRRLAMARFEHGVRPEHHEMIVVPDPGPEAPQVPRRLAERRVRALQRARGAPPREMPGIGVVRGIEWAIWQ